MGIFQRHLPTLWVLGGVQENKGNILRELDVLGGQNWPFLGTSFLRRRQAVSISSEDRG